MRRIEFSKLINRVRRELEPYGIQLVVDHGFNPEQMSCEFYANKATAPAVWFKKGNFIMNAVTSGSLAVGVYGTSDGFSSKEETDTFEEALGIHTDAELKQMESQLDRVEDNWFEIEVSSTNCHLLYYTDEDIYYNMADFIDSKKVVDIFKKAERRFNEILWKMCK